MKKLFIMFMVLIFSIMLIGVSFAQGTWVVTSKDAFTYFNSGTGAGGDENHGGEFTIRVRSDDAVGPDIFIRDAYLQFDLNPNLFKEDVKQAFLKLTVNRWYNQISGMRGQFAIYNMGETAWDEMGLTYNTSTWSASAPGEEIARTTKYINQIGSADPVIDLVFDITKFVWDQLDQGNTSFTLVLADTTAGKANANGTDARIYSKDATELDEKAPDSTYFPYVVLDENPIFRSYTRIPVAEDAYTNNAEPDAAHNEWQVRVRSASSTNLRDTYLKFSLVGSGYSNSADIEKVFLSITAERIVGNGNDLFHIWPLDDNSWSEETLTWNNSPWNKEKAKTSLEIVSSDTMANVSSSDPVKAIWFDMTDYVKAMVDSGFSEFSLVLSDTSYGTAWRNDGDMRFYAKESPTDGSAPSAWPKIPEESYVPTLYIKGTPATHVSSPGGNLPLSFEVYPNYPNPFNPTTTISYQLSKNGRVDVAVLNILGQEVRRLESGVQQAGLNSIEWDGKNDAGHDVSTGIYFSRIQAENQTKLIKMVLIR